MLARCAGDDKYNAMITTLFKQQDNWAHAEDAKAALLQLSKLAGFTQESFEACLTNQQLLNDVNATRERATKDFGINATPTFIINGKMYPGALTVEQMSGIIDSML
jgi:protein-disulfide isomerase